MCFSVTITDGAGGVFAFWGGANIVMVFYNVGALKVREFGGGLAQFMDFRVSIVEGGLDRIRFKLVEEEDEKISFKFHAFELLNDDHCIIE